MCGRTSGRSASISIGTTWLVADAVSLDGLAAAGAAIPLIPLIPLIEDRLIDPNTLLADMPAVTLTEEGERRAANGNTLAPGHLQTPVPGGEPGRRIRVLDSSGGLLSVAALGADGLLRPLLVLR